MSMRGCRGRHVAMGLSQALAYLHTRKTKVAHFDLKSANVLITADGRAKLADVGELPTPLQSA